MSDLSPATQTCSIARSSLMSSEDRLFSWVQIGRTAGSSLDLRSVNRMGNGGRRRSAKAVHFSFGWWLDELVRIEFLHAQFYGFEKVVGSVRATCLEPDGTVIRLRSD